MLKEYFLEQEEMMVKLYWFWSVNPQKIRLALEELEVPHEIIFVDFFKGELQQQGFNNLNLNRKVPIWLDGEMELWESNAMLVYLGEQENRLWPAESEKHSDALQWLFYESRHLAKGVGTLWYNDFIMPKVQRSGDPEARQAAETDLLAPLKVLEDHLVESPWMIGEEYTLVDCCYGPLLDALQLSQFDMAPFPATSAYLEKIRQRPKWAACEFQK